ncbi:sodium/glutamate symporter [Hoeflea prorocentri]|uniref:Sodium/glutamate symporter n=1 Tax=Hoeflea prorocentri TaxID=1922333 RepID=A0A9X3ULD0_9HYPH|nr:sodium/glutamate symporter [Hoeflea prorocentri]MCY6381111.1 sodium/glutamate symporter [Hoeflea prorocentri]MDA5398911.1 sodium/glutamate symporter [Hoeflea prorocentri]
MDNLATRTYNIDDFPAVAIGIIVFFLGAFLTRRVSFLKNYNIPEPVSGGLTAALVTWIIFSWFNLEITFDLSTRDELLVVFFVTIGLNARVSDLISGGRILIILLAVTLLFIVLQNAIGLVGATAFDLPRPAAVLLGSASLIGGHGTAIAWGPTIQEMTGFDAAAEIGVAAATLGLVCAALIGGPIAKHLIDRNQLEASASAGPIVGLPYRTDNKEAGAVNHISIMRSILAIYIAIIIGYGVNEAILSAGLKLPLFVSCLLVAIVMSNTIPLVFPDLPWPARTRALAVISDYSLSVFLAMSLMSLKLWSLAGLGGPLIGVLVLQVAGTAAFIVFIFFKIMGRDYTAAVLSSGFAGFTLGATPTAIANMSSVTKRYGPAPLAFIILPMVSAFFVDLANAVIIRFFITL